MATGFELDRRIEAGTAHVTDWPLCQLRLKDDARFPWLLLVPRLVGASEFTDLSAGDYEQCMAELLAGTRVMMEAVRPDKINVAMFGNIVPQMHLHVIGRFRSDAAWPGAVFAAGDGPEYAAEAKAELVKKLANAAARLRP
jgi:diadenosine tetraphosphate (Ap4A) HIT family hydrolase